MTLKNLLLRVAGAWDRIVFYGALICLVVLMKSFHADLARFSRSIQEDTRFLQYPPRYVPLIEEAWVDGLLETARQGHAAGGLRDVFSLDREALPDARSQEKEEAPPVAGADQRFSLIKIYRAPVRLLLKGYIRLPDGSYSLQINWAGQTDFRQVGETIRGYVIERFEKVSAPQEVQGKITQEIDQSYVIIRKGEEDPVTLEKGKLVTEKELFARIFDHAAQQATAVHVSSQIDTYKVVDIAEDQIILSDAEGKQITLTRSRERN